MPLRLFLSKGKRSTLSVGDTMPWINSQTKWKVKIKLSTCINLFSSQLQMWCDQLPHSLAIIRTSLPRWTILMNHINPFFLNLLLQAIYHSNKKLIQTWTQGRGWLPLLLLRNTGIPFGNASQNRESAYCLRSQETHLSAFTLPLTYSLTLFCSPFETKVLIKGKLTVVESDFNKGMQLNVL